MIERRRLERMREAFAERFGEAAGATLTLARGPGRVNLIGEHTDYNGGYVLPMAVEADVAILGAPADEKRGRTPFSEVALWSMDFEEAARFDVRDFSHDEKPWVNYPKGVAKFLAEEGVPITPCRAVIHATVPVGGGLSSSAAFEVASARLFLSLAGRQMDGVALAKLARKAENAFVGVQCGIMDQLIAVFGERGKALFIDCKEMRRRAVPLFGEDFAFVITNSMVKHSLGESEYHNRQHECAEGLRVLCAALGERPTLRDFTLDEFRAHRDAMSPVVRRRLDHVFTENARVLQAVEAMASGDAAAFGELMDASHDSLRDDYEVSCEEVDALVDAARRIEGVLGSRITGGGFGGCTVSLVERAGVDRFVESVRRTYRDKTGIQPTFLRSNAADGATVEQLG